MNAGIKAGHRLTRRLETARIGGTHGTGTPGTASGLTPVSFAEIHRGARAEIGRVAVPARRAAQQAQQAWTGKRKPPPPGTSGLQARLATTRGGRTVLGTAKAAGTAATIAFGSTIGAPVVIPRATKAVKTAAQARSAAMKAKLAAAKTKHGGTARQFSREWAANTGIAAATRALKKGPLPSAVLSTAIRTAPAASPRSKARYSAVAPRIPGAEPADKPAEQIPPPTPATLPKVKPWQPPPEITATKKLIHAHNPPPPKPPEPPKPKSVKQLRELLDKQNTGTEPAKPPRPTVITVTKATQPKKGPGPGTTGRSG